MPTPVSSARQCLTEEAAKALDDAVAVARRRSHAQTTSLHAVSALLCLPSSALRDACSRARSCAYPPRLQFRALDLSVGVSLDRLPSSKPSDEPPVSNSLMAAIKRSQANQRRHPDSFHLHQIHNQNQNPSILKVEIKYFILSILDDPIVSRVFGEAGFRSCDIKLAIIHPPLSHHPSRFSRSSRCPPIFLCNLTDSDLGHRNFPFPFAGDDDSNSRRIGEVLVRKTERNPLLIGVYAISALRSFTDFVQRCKLDVISGLRVICLEKEIFEFVSGNLSKEKMGLKFEEVFGMVQQCSGPGFVVNYGDLSGFFSDVDDDNRMGFVVSQLTDLLKLHSGRVWLIGAVGTYEIHEKFLVRFPTIEKDWDLHLLPITSKSIGDVSGPKSSLMGSFVPFGGFFPSQSNFPSQLSSLNHSFPCCHQCNEKYEQEVAAIWKPGSTSSLHMPMTELDAKHKEFDVYKTRDDRSTYSDELAGLQKKWNDICRLHQAHRFPKLDISQTRHGTVFESTRLTLDHERSGEETSSVTGGRSVIANSCLSRELQNNLNTQQARQILEISNMHTDNFQSRTVTGASPGIEADNLRIFSKSIVSDKLLPSPVISVTTDLGLGTLYASASENKRKVSELESKNVSIHHFTSSNPTEFSRPSNHNPSQSLGCSNPTAGRPNDMIEFSRPSNHNSSQSLGCSNPTAGQPLDRIEFKSLWNVLNEKVSWQSKATCSIVETVLRCRSGGGRRLSSISRGDIWLTFLGPDSIGKRKILSALAELMFGSRENLISVDFASQDRDRQPISLFDCSGVGGYDERFRGQTVVDYVAGELRKKPSLVVVFENVDKADVRTKSCLSQAIKTGKFPDSHGRQITINNTIFVTTSTSKKVDKTSNIDGEEPAEFSEERILTARNYQMQLLVERFTSNVSKHNDMNVRVKSTRGNSNISLSKKRKLDESKASSSMSFLDLNLPVEEVEEEGSNDGDCDSDSVSEGSETWLDEFLEQVDEKVTFEPYDFDEAASKLVKVINLQFKRVFGSEVVLEIDHEIVNQILAANWLSEKNKAMEQWVELVLHKSFVEAEQKYQMGSGSVMKLVCKEDVVDEQAPGIFLPARILLN